MNISKDAEGMIVELKTVALTRRTQGLDIPTTVELIVVEVVLSEHDIEKSRFVVECEHRRCYIGQRVIIDSGVHLLDQTADPREEIKMVTGQKPKLKFDYDPIDGRFKKAMDEGGRRGT